MTSTQPTVNSRNRQLLGCAGLIIVIGLLARAYGITMSFDGDEVSSIRLASKSLTDIIAHWTHKAHPPLHILLLHGWTALFGISEIAARSLSLLFSGGMLATSWLVLTRLFSSRVAIGTLSILSLSPFLTYFGQQSRPYSLLAFLTVLSLLAVLSLIRHGRTTRHFVFWVATCIALIYTQYLAVLIIAFEGLILLIVLRDHRLRIIACGLVPLIAIAPWLLHLAYLNANSATFDTIQWVTAPTLIGLIWFYVQVFGEIPGLEALLFVLGSTCGAIVAIQLWKNPLKDAFFWVCIAIAIAIPVLEFLVSKFGPVSIFGSRHLTSSAIASIILIGYACQNTKRVLGNTLLAGLVLWCVAAQISHPPVNAKPPWKQIASFVDSNFDKQIVYADRTWTKGPLSYYLLKTDVRSSVPRRDDSSSNSYLYICRPVDCDVALIADESSATLLETWSWNKGNPKYNRLMLYEIRLAQAQSNAAKTRGALH